MGLASDSENVGADDGRLRRGFESHSAARGVGAGVADVPITVLDFPGTAVMMSVDGVATSVIRSLQPRYDDMAKRQDVGSVLKKWTDNTSNATESMKAGVGQVTVAPSQQAAASSDLWQRNVSSQEAKDKFVAGLNAVSLADWQKAMREKGAANMANGVRAAGPKMQKFLQAFLPVAQASAEQIAGMPKGAESDSINRMVQNMRNMKAFRKNG